MTKSQKWKTFFFAAGVLILGYMIYAIGLDVIWENIRETGWWFLPIIGLWVVVYVLNALAWDVIMRDGKTPTKQHPSFLKVLKVTISGYCINYITPFIALGGEPYRILEMKDTLGVRRATASTLSYSLMHMLSHIVFWMSSIFLIMFWLKPSSGLIIGCVVAFAVFAFLLYLIFAGYKNGLIQNIFSGLKKLPFIKKSILRFEEKHSESLLEIDRNIADLSHNRKADFYTSLGLEVLARIVSCFELFFIAKAVGVDLGLMDSIVLYSGSTLFANILFFSPMQLGTREGGLALVLNMMGFVGTLGIFMGLVTRIRELFWIAVGLILMRINIFQKQKNTKKMNVKGIIFDYGGTIDTNGIHWFEVFYSAYENTNADMDKETLRQAYVFGERTMATHYEAIKPTDTFADILGMKIGYQMQYLIENNKANADLLELKKSIVAYCLNLVGEHITNAIPILDRLMERYPIVLVSNFYGNLNTVLKDYKLDLYFDEVVESAVVGIRKPNSAIFQKGLDALKLQAHEVVVIGDSYKNDIEPAKSLGCKTIWLKNVGWTSDDEDDKTADYIIKNLSDVLSLLAN